MIWWQIELLDIDVKVARAEEERIMEEHAQSWLNKGRIDAGQDPTTGKFMVTCKFFKMYLGYSVIWL